jgi:2-succinyl-6-hydroxy-2,4-cyclohexadiene-1-carboxylate synthase
MPEEERDSAPAHSPRTLGLHAETTGNGPPLVLAHGFTQTSRCWGSLADDLSADHRLVLVDLPGHGGSTEVEADLPSGADLLVRAGGRAGYVGYSMGARFCLHAALAHPESVTALVLISGTAGIEDPDERRARRRADEQLADELAPPSGTPPAITLDEFLRRWLAQPMFAGLDEAGAAFEERARNSPAGLASSLRHAGTGTQRPLGDRLAELEMPVLVVTGWLDSKFTELGHRMAEAIGPNASTAVVHHAGHAPHLEQPAAVAELTRSFFASAPG